MSRGLSERRRRGLRLQPRDFTLLTELGQFGFLPTDVIHLRHFPDDKTGVAVRRRLRLCADHGLIQTISIAIAYTGRLGRLPSFHRLTPQGAEVIFDETGVRPLRPGRSEVPKPHTILHRAGMAEVALRFTDACGVRGLALPEWYFEFDTNADLPPTAPLVSRLLLRREFRSPPQTTLTCWPDALCRFLLQRANRTWELAIAWEFDRSTERHAQLKTKLDGYIPWLREHAYRRQFPNAVDARIFFVVPTAQRQAQLIQTLREHSTAPFVRVTALADATSQAILAKPIWRPLDASAPKAILDD